MYLYIYILYIYIAKKKHPGSPTSIFSVRFGGFPSFHHFLNSFFHASIPRCSSSPSWAGGFLVGQSPAGRHGGSFRKPSKMLLYAVKQHYQVDMVFLPTFLHLFLDFCCISELLLPINFKKILAVCNIF